MQTVRCVYERSHSRLWQSSKSWRVRRSGTRALINFRKKSMCGRYVVSSSAAGHDSRVTTASDPQAGDNSGLKHVHRKKGLGDLTCQRVLARVVMHVMCWIWAYIHIMWYVMNSRLTSCAAASFASCCFPTTMWPIIVGWVFTNNMYEYIFVRKIMLFGIILEEEEEEEEGRFVTIPVGHNQLSTVVTNILN